MYIENISVKKKYFFLAFIYVLDYIDNDHSRWSNKTYRLWFIYNTMGIICWFFPPLNENSWNNYFDLYKKIPEFKLQNYDMTISEFKIIFGGNGYIDF